ncbi:tubulin binding cofactor C-domain-containing protein [Phycomyces nitens]|nr:tubulin binding cofactor C-domain-containing protein [Phycomyces nitens]
MSDSPASSTDASLKFWTEFKLERQNIADQLELSKSLAPSQLPQHFNNVLQTISRLEKELTKATEYIPPYDERQYAMQIKALVQELEAKRTALTPKPKFSFKSRKQKQKPAIIESPVDMPAKTVEPGWVEDDSMLRFADMSDQWLTLRDSRQTGKQSVDVSLSNLHRCVVSLLDDTIRVSALHIKNLTECIVLCGSIEGSVLLYGFTRSIIAIDCHQFRMHDAVNVDILLCVSSRPIIEDCDQVRVGPLEKKEPCVNYFDQMEDFNWLRKQASPHWRVMAEDESEKLNRSLVGNLDSLASLDPKERLDCLVGYIPTPQGQIKE